MPVALVFAPTRRIRAALLILCVMFIGACTDRPEVRPGVPVVVYVVDSLRADRLGVYGNTRAGSPSPNLDALAAESVIFDAAYAPAPWTLPSMASLLTSTWPCEHRVLDNARRLGPRPQTLATRLRAAGYTTIGMSANPLLGERSGLSSGFDVFEAPVGAYQFSEFTAHHASRPDAGTLFLYLHTLEPHNFFLTTKQFSQRFGLFTTPEIDRIRALWLSYRAATTVDLAHGRPRGTTDNASEQELFMASLSDLQARIEKLYDASVYQADDQVGKVIQQLKEGGLWDNAIVIVLSDHGTELGEHGGWSHEQGLYEEQVRVPLIIHFPGGAHAGTRIDTPVSLVDVMPTIFDALGAPSLCEECSGRSLLALLADTDAGDVAEPGRDARVLSVRDDRRTYYQPWKERRGDRNIALRKGDWKAIWNAEPGTLELYNLAEDPIEASDVSDSETELAGELAERARQWLAACGQGAPEAAVAPAIDEHVRKQLESVGYFE